MFKSMKVGVRLGLGFGLVVLLMVLLAVIATLRLGAVNDSTRVVVDDRFPKVLQANAVIRRVIDNGRLVRQMLLIDDVAEKENIKTRVRANLAGNSEDIGKLEKSIRSEKGKALLKDILDKRAVLATKYEPLFELAKGERAKSLDYLKNEFVPANNAILASLDALNKFQSEMMEKSAVEAQQSFVDTRLLIIEMTVAAVSWPRSWPGGSPAASPAPWVASRTT